MAHRIGTLAAVAAARVLFIGNSYTFFNDLPSLVAAFAAAAQEGVESAVFAPGGWTLERHWEDGEALARIKQGGWSHVVLQEQSTRPIEAPALTLEFGRRFAAEISAMGAVPVAYLTWARRDRPQTQAALNDTYCLLARESGAIVAPVGPAWWEILAARPDLTLHLDDLSHPAPLGSYAAAAVLFATITSGDPEHLDVRTVNAGEGSGGAPVQLAVEDAALVRRVAAAVTKTWAC